MQWVPERYPKAGGLAAAGFYKLLGRPRLDPLTVLVRETAQNSWDARLNDEQQVRLTFAGRHLADESLHALRNDVFVLAAKARGTHLADQLRTNPTLGLFVADRGTKGLGGPLSADTADPNGGYRWVNFVLNVGKENKDGHTGGTYGFGKTISYVVSRANAVVIHSRTEYRGKQQTRLIACAIGDEFTLGGRLHTGRHWWGEDKGGAPRPVTGRTADRLAARIGMPAFREGETGTNILIVAPDLNGRTPEQAMRFISESVAWHLWPKIMDRRGDAPMKIDVSWNDSAVPVPRPEERPPLDGFAAALRAIRDQGFAKEWPLGMRVDVINCGRPLTTVGELATVPLVERERADIDDGSDQADLEAPAPAAAVVGPCHHIALMRTPELVVEYLEGPGSPEGGVEWAGVFRPRDEHDHHFAAAEPPTHDAWTPSLLPKSAGRTIVNVGLREIRATAESRWSQRERQAQGDGSSTAIVANALAHLVRTIDGKGPGTEPKGTSPSPSRTKPRVEVVESGPVDLENRPASSVRARVTHAAKSSGTRLHVGIAAALDGTQADAELDPELRLVTVEVDGDVRQVSGSSLDLELESGEPVEVVLLAARGPETTVLFDLDAESAE